MHALRIENSDADPATLAMIRRLRLGREKGWHDQKRASQRKAKLSARLAHPAVELGKTSGLTGDDLLKVNRYRLPEVALFGHSNCGKSALLNALVGVRARTGIAEVDSRAGWTMRLHFYWVRPRGLLDKAAAGSERGAVLVDTPGYGHAVGERAELRHWRSLIDTYIDTSPSLRLALLLIDCTRGLCDADRRVLRLLSARGVRTIAALTKCDLLAPDPLARSHRVVLAQIDEANRRRDGAPVDPRGARLSLLSSHFYTGIEQLWDELDHELRLQMPCGDQIDSGRCGSHGRTIVERRNDHM